MERSRWQDLPHSLRGWWERCPLWRRPFAKSPRGARGASRPRRSSCSNFVTPTTPTTRLNKWRTYRFLSTQIVIVDYTYAINEWFRAMKRSSCIQLKFRTFWKNLKYIIYERTYLLEHLQHCLVVAQIDLIEMNFLAGDRFDASQCLRQIGVNLLMRIAQIIDANDMMAGIQQFQNGMWAHISSTTGHQHCQRCHNKRFRFSIKQSTKQNLSNFGVQMPATPMI